MRHLLLAVVPLAALGCTGTVEATGGDDGVEMTPGDPQPDAGELPGVGAVARARQWADAKLGYCQAPNHQHDNDADCAATCTRLDNPEWDPYRSDCSGLVSWSWALPAPGRTTAGFAPFQTDLTHGIPAIELRPGDAVNNDHHVMLFAGWVSATEARFIDEPGCSSSTPYAHEFTVTVTPAAGNLLEVQYRGMYTAIRYDAAP